MGPSTFPLTLRGAVNAHARDSSDVETHQMGDDDRTKVNFHKISNFLNLLHTGNFSKIFD